MPAITITDLENAKTDVDHLAAIANSTAPTATDRLGRTKQTLAGLSAEFPNAAANAAAAAASATQAANEATSAAAAVDAAFAEATAAQASRVAAESARDAAQLSAGVYATTAAGLAATTTGRYFSVPSADSTEYLILYLNNAGAAVEQKRYPSVAGVDARAQVLRHIPSPATLVEDAGAVSLTASSVKDVVAITDVDLNAMGYYYANRMDALATAEEQYAYIDIPPSQKKFGFGNYVALSVLIQTTDWAGVNASRIRGIAFGEVQNTFAAMTTYDEIRPDLRRYYGVFQITNASLLNLNHIWLEVTTVAGRSAAVYVTGSIAAVSNNKPYGVIWRDAADWQRRMNLLDAAEIDRVQGRGSLAPIVAPSLTLEDLGNPSMSSANRDVQPIVDTDLNAMGYYYAQRSDNLAILEDSYGIVTVPATERKWKTGDWVAISVLVKTNDWAGLDTSRVRTLLFNKVSGSQTLAAMTSYDEIRSDLHRYHGVFQITSASITDLDRVWIEVTGKAGRSAALYITGYMAALSADKPTGLDWRGAYGRYVTRSEIDTANARVPLLKSIVQNGAFKGGAAQALASQVGGVSISAITDSYLNGIGITHAATMATLTAQQETYLLLTPDRGLYKAGDWIAVALFIKTADWSSVNASRIRLLCFPDTGGGTQGNVVITGYEEIRTDLRRYNTVVQVPSTITSLSRIWFEVTAPASRTAAVYVTGFAGAVSPTRPGGVDWSDFDPYSELDHETRIGSLELVVGTGQTEPKLVVPSSFHLVEGRPLTLYRSGLSEFGRSNNFEIAFVGKKNGLPFVKYVDSQIDLDGSRLSGPGFVYSRSKTATTPKWRRPVTFYSSAATKTGSPKILVIGDSLTEEGTITTLKNKLVAAGLTPQFIGTYNDAGGTPGEGRASWEFSDFTRKYTEIFAGQPTYPIDATGGDGVVTTVAQYLALANNLRWKYNPFVRPTQAGDDPALVKNGYVFDMAFYLTRFSFATPDIVMIALGTNDFNSNPDATSAANVAEGLQIMIGQIKAAAPSAKIGILFKDAHAEAFVAIKAAMQTYGGREAEGLFILPMFSVLDPYLSYGADGEVTINSTDSIGVQNLTQNDLTHPDSIGREQWAEMTFAFVMNRI